MSAINLKQAVLSTAAFFDLFDYALTLDELERYLFSEIKHNRKNVESYLKNSPKIKIDDGYFYLSDRINLIEKRKQKERIANNLWGKANNFAHKLRYVPFIKCVCVCNKLAFNCAREKSDIDLFIITKRNRLFLARFFVTALAQILGVRRHGKKTAGRFCLSFFISEDNLDFRKLALTPYDIYLAFWIRTLKPLIDDGILSKFMSTNKNFLRKYFATDTMVDRSKQIDLNHYAKKTSRIIETLLNGKLGNFIENCFKKWQLKRARSKCEKLEDKSGTIISDKILKFHNIDKRRHINNRWKNRVEGLLRI